METLLVQLKGLRDSVMLPIRWENNLNKQNKPSALPGEIIIKDYKQSFKL